VLGFAGSTEPRDVARFSAIPTARRVSTLSYPMIPCKAIEAFANNFGAEGQILFLRRRRLHHNDEGSLPPLPMPPSGSLPLMRGLSILSSAMLTLASMP
jgi:hypothetical protein